MNEKTYTKGNIIVEDIQIGDILYEFEYGCCVKSKVLTKPILDENGNYVWQCENLNGGRIIEYLVNPRYSHYSANLYDYEAYSTNTFVS